MYIKKGDSGHQVEQIQEALGLTVDGIFGPNTEKEVKNFQKAKGLTVDGIVGPQTLEEMGILTTDLSDKVYETHEGLKVEKYYLPRGEYLEGPTEKEYLFLHHTAGWNNPYRTIDSWGRDRRGRIATQFVIGGPNPSNGDETYDGVTLECFDDEGYAWHLGKNGSQHMHTHSIGIEVCNFGYLTKAADGTFRTYADTIVLDEHVIDLGFEFRGYRYWHDYSDKQLESLELLIKEILRRNPKIDPTQGLSDRLRSMSPADAFEWYDDAYYGKVKGILSHTSTMKGKFDMYPHPKLVEILKKY